MTYAVRYSVLHYSSIFINWAISQSIPDNTLKQFFIYLSERHVKHYNIEQLVEQIIWNFIPYQSYVGSFLSTVINDWPPIDITPRFIMFTSLASIAIDLWPLQITTGTTSAVLRSISRQGRKSYVNCLSDLYVRLRNLTRIFSVRTYICEYLEIEIRVSW